MPTPLRFQTLEQRFLAKVKKVGSCLIWTGSTDRHGYGQLWVDGKLRVATHVAFFLKHGRWPKPCALHTCDTPGCVRWRHLFEGTKRDNTKDMMRKGCHSHGVRHARTLYKFSSEQVRRTRAMRADGDTERTIAKKFNCVPSTIHWVVVGRRYAEVA